MSGNLPVATCWQRVILDAASQGRKVLAASRFIVPRLGIAKVENVYRGYHGQAKATTRLLAASEQCMNAVVWIVASNLDLVSEFHTPYQSICRSHALLLSC
jgi:hypothetical protein